MIFLLLQKRYNSITVFLSIIIISILAVYLYFRPIISNINKVLLNGSLNTESFCFIWNFWWFDYSIQNGKNIFETDYIYNLKPHSLYLHTFGLWQTLTTYFLKSHYIARFNFSLILSHFLTIVFSFYLIRYFKFNFWLSLLGALLFNFSPFRLNLYTHLNISNIEFIPLFLLLLFKFNDSPSIKTSLGLIIVLIIQFLSEYNYFVYFNFIILILVFTNYFFYKKKNPIYIKYTIIIWILTLIITSPILIPMLKEIRNNISQFSIHYSKTIYYCADLFAVFIPNIFTKYFPINFQLHKFNIYGGLFIILTVLYSIIISKEKDKNYNIKFSIIIMILFFILTLGGTLHIFGSKIINTKYGILLPYIILNKLPIINSCRIPYRFYSVVQLTLTILFIYSLSKIRNKKIFYLIIVLAIVDFIPYLKYNIYQISIPDYYNEIRTESDNYSILELPLSRDNDAYMLYQTVHHKKILGSGIISRMDYSKNQIEFLNYIPYNALNLKIKYYFGLKQKYFPNSDNFDFLNLRKKYNVKYFIIHKNQVENETQFLFLKNALLNSGYLKLSDIKVNNGDLIFEYK